MPSSVAITGGAINGTIIGLTTPSSASFTTINAGAAAFNGGLTSTSGSFSTTLGVTGAATFGSTLAVTGSSNFSGSLTVNNTLYVTGSSGSLTLSDQTSTGAAQLYRSGKNLYLYDSTYGNNILSFNSTNGTMFVSGPTSFSTIAASGSITTSGSLIASNTLQVASGMVVNVNQIYTQSGPLYLQNTNATGGVSICGQGGTTTIGGNLTVASSLSAGSVGATGGSAQLSWGERTGGADSGLIYRSGGVNRLYDSTSGTGGDVIQYTGSSITLLKAVTASAGLAIPAAQRVNFDNSNTRQIGENSSNNNYLTLFINGTAKGHWDDNGNYTAGS